jgi:hypothetical protein
MVAAVLSIRDLTETNNLQKEVCRCIPHIDTFFPSYLQSLLLFPLVFVILIVETFLKPHFLVCSFDIPSSSFPSRFFQRAGPAAFDSTFHVLPHGLQVFVGRNVQRFCVPFALQIIQLLLPPLGRR